MGCGLFLGREKGGVVVCFSVLLHRRERACFPPATTVSLAFSGPSDHGVRKLITDVFFV